MLDYVYEESFDWAQMFRPDKLTEFDIRKAGIAACLARDSYYNDLRYAETLLMLGFSDVQLFSDNHLQAIVGCRDIKTPDGTIALIAVVFRGSDEARDWLDNIDVRKTRFLNTAHFPHLSRLKVHNGIFENVHDFEDKAGRVTFQNGEVKGNLTEILKDESKRNQCFFWIIGHSLGGAMATLFAARLYDFYSVSASRILIHTFGAPPIGNRYFAAHYGHRSKSRMKDTEKKSDLLTIFRFLNTEDPVPGPHFATPAEEEAEGGSITQPPYHFLGFRHVGREIRFSPRFLPGFYEKYEAFTGRRYNSSNFMKVHFMEAYMTGVDALNPVKLTPKGIIELKSA